jgi:cell division protein YceG involved in septum cleavage
MDEAKRMEEGNNSPHNETVLEGESVDQLPKEQVVKHKTSRVATLDAFRGLTIVVS